LVVNLFSQDAKTASSYDEATTPKTPPMEFGIREMSAKSMTVGPRGPHLFRSLSTSSAGDFAYEEYASPISPIASKSHPFARSVPDVQEIRDYEQEEAPIHNLKIDVNYRPMSSISIALEDVLDSEIESWSTLQVCNWMHELGFDETLISKFRKNDISGAILMQLQWEDLKELNIQSFGKRIELWSELNHLRKSPQIPSVSPVREDMPLDSPGKGLRSPPILSRQASKKSRESNFSRGSSSRSSPTVRQSDGSLLLTPTVLAGVREVPAPDSPYNQDYFPVSPVSPELSPPRISAPSSVSDAEFEEDFVSDEEPEANYDENHLSPEDHSHLTKPSLGERRRGRAVPALALVRSRESLTDGRKSGGSIGKSGPVFTAARPSKKRVVIPPALMSPLSPSPRMIDICFEAAMTPATGPRRVSMLVPPSPRWANAEPVPSVCASSDVLGQENKTNFALKTDNLRKVTMLSAQEQVNKYLTLQHLQSLEDRVQSPPPGSSLLSPRQVPLPASPANAPRHSAINESANRPVVQRSMSLKNFPQEKTGTIERSYTARSPREHVPQLHVIDTQPKYGVFPSTRPEVKPYVTPVTPQLGASNKSIAPSTSSSGKNVPSNKSQMASVHEDPEWEDTSSGHGSAPPSPSERVFAGEMKKRTNNWLRHEWTTHRVELRGTRLAIYKSSTSRDVLQTIEMDDYTVSCASAGSNKFGRSLKTSGKKDCEGNFNFQLMPIKKLGEKEHHFAVSTREERIDWMRELMLAKAIKQKKSGFQVEVNGKMI